MLEYWTLITITLVNARVSYMLGLQRDVLDIKLLLSMLILQVYVAM